MPVTARRTSLSRGVSHTESAANRTFAKHRRPSKSAVPRAAAAVVSVGLAVSGGALVTIAAAPTTASAAALSPAQARGHQTIKSRPLLRKGDSGPTVKFVQRALRLGPDGYYGNTTVVALKKFQLSWGIKVSGTTDHATWGRLTWAAKHKVLYGNKGGVKADLFRAKVLKEAAKLKGTPYRYGGTTTRGFDCSGYTGYVYSKSGKKMPRTSRQQYAATTHISAKAAKPGDLIFFKNGGGSVYHVGIYAGKGLLWHSSKPGTPIQKGKIWTKSVAFGRV
ncbi:peptidoglycan endopeptidase [Kribbella antibiotica]|uniref:Peptidoglycan endopeptidase n=1 Tax=Kribbella antibiotica TaxID=190195 RepID=A0A4R4ZHH1_9ACTN|nr:NlpC/P60 family protein [Kribbella antibiotica]TDD57144.1 peptidoglycan endopeptidase [Kribbella antibiotica]